MRKNVASQVVGAHLKNRADGTPFTGTATVFIIGDNGTRTAGTQNSGNASHKGNGSHTYAPSQAETNFDHVAFEFAHADAVAVMVQMYTDFPQTGDSFARIGAPASTVSADIAALKAVADAILVDTGTDGVVVAAASVSAIQSGLATTSGLGIVNGNVLAVAALIGSPAATLAADIAAIKAIADSLTARLPSSLAGGLMRSDIKSVNAVPVTGVGTTGDPWNP